MAQPLLIVDGTNVSWAWPRSRPLMLRQQYGEAQCLLVQAAVDSPLRSAHEELLFVFDGPPAPRGPGSGRGTRVLHPDIGHSADDRILQIIGQRRHGGGQIVLVSSDRALRDAARAMGATTMGAMELIARLDPRGLGGSSEPGRRQGPSEKPKPSSQDTAAWLKRFGSREQREPPRRS
ncbi:MAG: NYN domain-containing protein [Candidatus Dormibacteria bacterium]